MGQDGDCVEVAGIELICFPGVPSNTGHAQPWLHASSSQIASQMTRNAPFVGPLSKPGILGKALVVLGEGATQSDLHLGSQTRSGLGQGALWR